MRILGIKNYYGANWGWIKLLRLYSNQVAFKINITGKNTVKGSALGSNFISTHNIGIEGENIIDFNLYIIGKNSDYGNPRDYNYVLNPNDINLEDFNMYVSDYRFVNSFKLIRFNENDNYLTLFSNIADTSCVYTLYPLSATIKDENEFTVNNSVFIDANNRPISISNNRTSIHPKFYSGVNQSNSLILNKQSVAYKTAIIRMKDIDDCTTLMLKTRGGIYINTLSYEKGSFYQAGYQKLICYTYKENDSTYYDIVVNIGTYDQVFVKLLFLPKGSVNLITLTTDYDVSNKTLVPIKWQIDKVQKFNNISQENAVVSVSTLNGNGYCRIKDLGNAICKTNVYTSETRPTNVFEGFECYDSTLKKKILWNGKIWVNLDGTSLDLKKSGTTSERPINADIGFIYKDTTLNKLILWEGTKWVNLDGTEL